MLVLAFDTATDVATSALVEDGLALAERVSVARSLLSDVDEMLKSVELDPFDLDALVVGTGPEASPARGSGSRSLAASRSSTISRSPGSRRSTRSPGRRRRVPAHRRPPG